MQAQAKQTIQAAVQPVVSAAGLQPVVASQTTTSQNAVTNVALSAQSQLVSSNLDAQNNNRFLFGGEDTASTIASFVSQAAGQASVYGSKGEGRFGVSFGDTSDLSSGLQNQFSSLSQNINTLNSQNDSLSQLFSLGNVSSTGSNSGSNS